MKNWEKKLKDQFIDKKSSNLVKNWEQKLTDALTGKTK